MGLFVPLHFDPHVVVCEETAQLIACVWLNCCFKNRVGIMIGC